MTNRRVDERYTLVREIGRGGSGPVWLGEDEVLGRTVAIKRIGLPPGAGDVDALRAEREARLAARVNHPHVVAVFDLVEAADDHWLVMEYVDGTTLAERIRDRGPLSPDDAARILLQVAEALAAAHSAGIVHRDVKPSNILIASDGAVKLSDFGIARAVADASLTQTGLVTGSPAYLSPEVASGGSATPASDVWSFGATLYHCLAGRPPYDVGENLMGALYRIVHEEPPALDSAGWLGPLLAATMTKAPQDRPTMADVVHYFEALPPDEPGTSTAVLPMVAPQPGPTAPEPPALPAPPAPPAPSAAAPAPPRSRSRRRLVSPALIGVAVVVVLALIGAALLLGGDDEDPVAEEPGGGATGSSSQSTSEPPSSPTSEPPAAPTAAELESFGRDYVATASSDPAAGFELLTPAYQQGSPRYEEFWGSVSNARIQQISADPDAMQVTYTYTYDFAGSGSVTETVTLNLVQEGDQLLIASATSG